MSRTWKDKSYKLTENCQSKWEFCHYTDEEGRIRCFSMEVGGRKKVKKTDVERHWMSTPSWHTRLYMNRPQRREGRIWETTINRVVDIEDVDPPTVSKKPHEYYY